MKSEVELQHFYEEEFRALLEPLEQYRLANVRRVRLFSYLALVSVIISGLCILSELSFLVVVFIIPTFFFLGFAFQVLLKLSAHLTKQYKYEILPKLLGFLYEDYEYIARQKIAKSVLEKSMRAQAIIRNVIIGIGLVLFLITGLILFGYNQKRKANQLLELQNAEIAAQRDEIEAKSEELSKAFVQIRKQNDNITGSIAYAQRIQEALLPTEESLHKVIPESFIFLKPRDVVSGDFYWFAKSHPSIRYMSKKSFKKAIGLLYKEKLISINDDGIRLLEK